MKKILPQKKILSSTTPSTIPEEKEKNESPDKSEGNEQGDSSEKGDKPFYSIKPSPFKQKEEAPKEEAKKPKSGLKNLPT